MLGMNTPYEIGQQTALMKLGFGQLLSAIGKGAKSIGGNALNKAGRGILRATGTGGSKAVRAGRRAIGSRGTNQAVGAAGVLGAGYLGKKVVEGRDKVSVYGGLKGHQYGINSAVRDRQQELDLSNAQKTAQKKKKRQP